MCTIGNISHVYASEDVSIAFIDNTFPRWDLDAINVFGSTTNAAGTDTISVDWGDGSTDAGIAIAGDGSWFASHTFTSSAVGTNNVVAKLVNASSVEIASTIPSTVDVQKHTTSLTINPLFAVFEGDNITVNGTLNDDDVGVGIGGATLHFDGTGATAIPDTVTNPDGTFSSTGSAPNIDADLVTVVGHLQNNSIYSNSDSNQDTFDIFNATKTTVFPVAIGSQVDVNLPGFGFAASIQFQNVINLGNILVSECDSPASIRYVSPSPLQTCLKVSPTSQILAPGSATMVNMSYTGAEPLPTGYNASDIDMFHNILPDIEDITQSRDTINKIIQGKTTNFSDFVLGLAVHLPTKPADSVRQTVLVGDNQEVNFRNITNVTNSSATAFLDKSSYSFADTAILTVNDPEANVDQTQLNIETVKINSTTSTVNNPDSISLNVTETGPNTGIFQGSFKFTSGASSGNFLQIAPGDVISINLPSHASMKAILNGITQAGAVDMTDYDIIANDPPFAFNPVFLPIGGAVDLKLVDAQMTGGTVQVTISYANADLKGQDPAFLDIFHLEPGNNWVVATTSRDPVAKTIIGQVSTLSPFTLGCCFGSVPGGGGGGLVRPGLVLNFLVAFSSPSNGGSIYVPPSLDLSGLASVQGQLPDSIRIQVLNHDPYKPMSPSYDTTFDYPFSIDGGGYAISGHSNPILTKTEEVGIPTKIKLNIPSSTLRHVALYTNLRGDARDIDKSDTFIVYEKGNPLQIVDPHGYIANVKFDLTTVGIKNTIVYTITFAKPMERSDIDLRVWDQRMASADTRILDAWQVDPQSLTAPSQAIPITAPTQNTESVLENHTDLIPAIKDWGGYSSNPISDSEFLSHMGISGQFIPKWVTTPAKYVVDGDLTPQEFETIVKYLASQGIVK